MGSAQNCRNKEPDRETQGPYPEDTPIGRADRCSSWTNLGEKGT